MKGFIVVTILDDASKVLVHYSQIYFKGGMVYFNNLKLLETVEYTRELIKKAQ